MAIDPPVTPPAPPEPPAESTQPTNPAPTPPPVTVHPVPVPSGDGRAHAWATVVVVVLVLGSAGAMLATGHQVHESLLLAGGVTLLGLGVARRILAQGALLPTIAIACAVTAFAVVLIVYGYDVPDVAALAGGAGLLAGEVTARALRTTDAPRRGV